MGFLFNELNVLTLTLNAFKCYRFGFMQVLRKLKHTHMHVYIHTYIHTCIHQTLCTHAITKVCMKSLTDKQAYNAIKLNSGILRQFFISVCTNKIKKS